MSTPGGRREFLNAKLASYRRGCEALVSHAHGLTWDVARKSVLDDFEYFGESWFEPPACGHLYIALLDDGSILTCYGNYPTKNACLIKWGPTSQ